MLAYADTRIRRLKVERDYAIETARTLDRLAAGPYSLETRASDAKCREVSSEITVVHPERVVQPVWLVSASFEKGNGLTLRFSTDVSLRDPNTPALDLFEVEYSRSLFKADALFEAIEGREIRCTHYGMVLPITLKTGENKSIPLEKCRVRIDWCKFVCEGTYSTYGPTIAKVALSD